MKKYEIKSGAELEQSSLSQTGLIGFDSQLHFTQRMVTPASEKKHHNTYGILALAVCAKALMSRRFCILFLSDAVPSRGLACIQVRSLQTATGGQLSIAADTGM